MADSSGDFYCNASAPSNDVVERQQANVWFAGLRSKLATFSMGDWWNQLGIKRQQQPSKIDPNRASSVGPIMESYGESEEGIWDRIELNEDDGGDLTPFVVTPTSNGGEPWELPTFWLNLEPGRNYHDTLQLQHFGPLDDLVPVGKNELGIGHDFRSTQLVNPTWCDKCGDFIWGFFKQAVTCSNCSYTCHYKCRMLVTLDCRSLSDSIKTNSTLASFQNVNYLTAKSAIIPQVDDFPAENYLWSDKDAELTEMDDIVTQLSVNDDPLRYLDELGPEVTREKLQVLITEYNCTSHGLGIALNPDGVGYAGYVRIHMNFSRPINVVAGQRPPSVYDVVGSGVMTMASDIEGHKTITSFFLPRNTVKILHVDSDMTTREMIVSLLRKFKVADNPTKFALYERRIEDGDTLIAKLLRIPDNAYPLRLALQWGGEPSKRFVLQENDSGDVLWDAFEIPELHNFLKILELEEQQYAWQVKQRYNLYRHYLELEIRERAQISGQNKTTNPETKEFAQNGDFEQSVDPFGTGNEVQLMGEQDMGDPWIVRETNFATIRPADQTDSSSKNRSFDTGTL